MRRAGQLRTVEHGPRWIAGRARNALRQSAVVAIIGGLTFLVALIALVLVPRQARRRAVAVIPPTEARRPDTLAVAARAAAAEQQVAAADSALAAVRVAAAPQVRAVAVDTFPPHLVARREAIAATIGSINRLLERAANAPLPASYRALGESPALRDDPRVRALLDSLAQIERERDAFDNLGGVDPIYVALTARATAVGRSVEAAAEARRAALRRELAALLPEPPPPPPPRATPEDTLAAVARLAAAQQSLDEARGALARARAENAESDRRLERARELANVVAPPVALLAAALVLGIAAGFGGSLLLELRHPRLADAAEAERATEARVLATIRAHAPAAERSRRRNDAELPDYIEHSADTYRLLYYRFAPTGAALPMITITGDEPEIAATVAANLAAASAFEARSTLLVDGDLAHGAVSRVVRVPSRPGLAAVLDGSARWAEAIVSTSIGRDGLLDVIPSGRWTGDEPEAAAAADARHALTRLASRYDLAVLVAPASHAERGARSLLPSPDVVVCARVGHTPLVRLVQTVDQLRSAGDRVLGLVLWEDDPPSLSATEELAPRRRWTPRSRIVVEESAVG